MSFSNEMQQNAIMASVSAEDLTHLKPQTGKTKPLSRLDIFHTAMAIKNGKFVVVLLVPRKVLLFPNFLLHAMLLFSQ